MKKQMMTLAMCLALTATSAMATTTVKTAATAAKKPVAAVSKTATKAVVKTTTPIAVQTKAPEVTLTPEQIAKQKFEAKMVKDREDLYCKLGLSSEQKTKAEELHKKSRENAEPLMAKLHEEKAKLHQLKESKACPIAICEQKVKVKEIKNALRANREAMKKDFEALLNKDQLTKFKAIREEKKAECKKCKGHHHHYEFQKHDEEGMHAPSEAAPGQPAPKCPCEAK